MKIKVPGIAIALIMLISVFTSSNLKWGKNHWKNIFGTDAKGYYSYLPAVFIYHDLNFLFYDSIENKYFIQEGIFDYREKIGETWVDKYYCGTALCELPFFFTAHLFAQSMGYENDGFTKPYAIAICIAALFFLFTGLFYLKKFLELYDVKKWNLSLILIASVLGTNLFYYTVCAPGMSHIYSFAVACIFLYATKKFFLSHARKYLICIGITLGIIVLIRPVNILVLLFIPFLAGNLDSLKLGFKQLIKNIIHTILGLLFFFIIIAFQLIIYKISTGNFFVYSYTTEGFNFSEVNIINFLFSYKKGMFLYTPVIFVSFVSGLFYLWKQRKFEFFSFLAAFIITVYILSSWWMWWYGGSFGCRVFIEYIPLISVLLGISIIECKNRTVKFILLFLVVFLIFFTQFQTYQYRLGNIHWEDMNYEKYWDSFMKLGQLIK